MVYARIIYDAGGGDTALDFLHPPRVVPGYQKAAVRHDNIAASGVKESIHEHTAQIIEFDVPWVEPGADLAAWSAFLDFALTGGQFRFYPDAALPDHVDYTLENMDIKLERVAPSYFSLSGLRFRKVVTY